MLTIEAELHNARTRLHYQINVKAAMLRLWAMTQIEEVRHYVNRSAGQQRRRVRERAERWL